MRAASRFDSASVVAAVSTAVRSLVIGEKPVTFAVTPAPVAPATARCKAAARAGSELASPSRATSASAAYPSSDT